MGKALHDKRGARCARGPITAERRGHFMTKLGVWHWRCHKNILSSRDNSTAESLTSRGQPGTLSPSPHQHARVDRWTEQPWFGRRKSRTPKYTRWGVTSVILYLAHCGALQSVIVVAPTRVRRTRLVTRPYCMRDGCPLAMRRMLPTDISRKCTLGGKKFISARVTPEDPISMFSFRGRFAVFTLA